MNRTAQNDIRPAEPVMTEEVIEAAVRAAQAEEAPPPKERRKVPLTHRTGAKVLAFILVIVMTALAAVSFTAGVVMLDQELYTIPEQRFREDLIADMAMSDARRLAEYVRELTGNHEDARDYCEYSNIEGVFIVFAGREGFEWQYGSVDQPGQRAYTRTLFWYPGEYYLRSEVDSEGKGEDLHTVSATVFLAEELTAQDHYFLADRLITLAYALRYWIWVILVGAALLAVASFVFLMCASGRRAGFDGPRPGWGTWVPVDALTFATAMTGFLVAGLFVESTYFHSAWKQIVVCGLCGLAIAVMVLGWCMSMALRFKLGGWWKNSVVWYCLRLCRRVLGWSWRCVRGIFRACGALLGGIPLVWKTAAVFLAVCAVELFAMMCCYHRHSIMLLWLMTRPIVFAVVIAVALMLRRLQKGGEALAAGNLGHQVNTKRLVGDFRRHGEDLNRIGEGITAAVEQRMRSERMKTELITNVSHDIKTPLTSIINYADLIGQEPCDNPRITEYAGVLHRQSERLKRLIEDLVEASKASTGNLEVLMAPCEVGVLLSQAAGEYQERLEQSRLELVTKQPEQPVRILADGRRLWRVFDNLMNNVCKYAQPGTRVYLTLEEREGDAVITFRNTSREALNVSADELMERFVRGDAARTSEGSGLGLSIARSLTELQNGTLDLTVDGDLFKVTLRFPVAR